MFSQDPKQRMRVYDVIRQKFVDVEQRKCPTKCCYAPYEWRGVAERQQGEQEQPPRTVFHYADRDRWHLRCLTRDIKGCPQQQKDPRQP
jgi:hypothetical protein